MLNCYKSQIPCRRQRGIKLELPQEAGYLVFAAAANVLSNLTQSVGPLPAGIKDPAASNGVSNLQRCRAAGYLTLAAVLLAGINHREAIVMIDGKKVLFSGMQSTGNLTLGNYLGALKNWVSLSDEYECFYSVVDMHSITVRQDPSELRKRARNLLTLYIAAGLDPQKNCIYYQSHVSGHAELAWILNCFTYIGELNRMTQFKDKAAKHADNINAGLYTYPVLMAADILLYQADVVPVGKDQLQHLEITRDIAQRFNAIYGDIFTIPEPYMGKAGANIRSLQNPEKKMSKSDENANASIYLMDDPDTIIRKFKRAVTDSEASVRYREEQPGIKNLIEIYCACTGKTPEETEKEFDGKGYSDFKPAVGEAVVSVLKPIQDRFYDLSKDKAYIDNIIKENAGKANYYATKTLRKVQKKIGFPERIR